MTGSLPLSRLRHAVDRHQIDVDSGEEVFHATTPHAMIQAAGYLKHTRATSTGKGVFFRGQSRNYSTLSPSLFRGIKTEHAASKRRMALSDFLSDVSDKKLALRSVSVIHHEAILQHYGIRTTWLDVVDNFWIALWFACHEAKMWGWPEQHINFERRHPEGSQSGADAFVYILLIESAYFHSATELCGHYRDEQSETIDLRVALPSHFVRPHAQHAIQVRFISKRGKPELDYKPMHVGTIRVRLTDAVQWLGQSSTLVAHALFPPAYYDYGYQELLKFVATKHETLGAIHRVHA